MIDVVAGVDSSTQSCTVELRDAASGALVSTGRAPHPVTHPPISEQDPESWWQALVAAMGDARRDVEVRIIGVSVGAQCHGLVVSDEAGRLLRPARLWNDTTSGRRLPRCSTGIPPPGGPSRSGSSPRPPSPSRSSRSWQRPTRMRSPASATSRCRTTGSRTG